MRKPTSAAALTLALLSAMGVAGCGGAERPQVQGPAPTQSPAPGPVYVNDWLGHPLSRPKVLSLTEFTTLLHLKWRNWGQPKAQATGEVSGAWCSPGCTTSRGYSVTVELSGLERQEKVSYYSRAGVRSSHHLPASDGQGDLRSLPLTVPEP
ncbi:hypothetical protein [Streptomyces sp. NPDC056039]|uniref:hypothetical protein n=1 Tax=Streptomyces sp. NPDC056039 TaxID=3345687 RepID=UPI0035D81C89